MQKLSRLTQDVGSNLCPEVSNGKCQGHVGSVDLMETVEKLQGLASERAFERPDIARKINALAREIELARQACLEGCN